MVGFSSGNSGLHQRFWLAFSPAIPAYTSGVGRRLGFLCWKSDFISEVLCFSFNNITGSGLVMIILGIWLLKVHFLLVVSLTTTFAEFNSEITSLVWRKEETFDAYYDCLKLLVLLELRLVSFGGKQKNQRLIEFQRWFSHRNRCSTAEDDVGNLLITHPARVTFVFYCWHVFLDGVQINFSSAVGGNMWA